MATASLATGDLLRLACSFVLRLGDFALDGCRSRHTAVSPLGTEGSHWRGAAAEAADGSPPKARTSCFSYSISEFLFKEWSLLISAPKPEEAVPMDECQQPIATERAEGTLEASN